MRAALHLILTPIVFAFGWTLIASSFLPRPVQVAGWLAAVAGGVAYGWKNRRQ